MTTTRTLYSTLRNVWEKNWPDIEASLRNGMPDFVLRARPKDIHDNVPVFCYHVVAADALEADLRYLLRNGYKTIDAAALVNHLLGRETVERGVVLTFDDGAKNLYQVVFPLLLRYKMKAVAFIAPHLHREDDKDAVNRDEVTAPGPLTWSEIREIHASGCIDFQSHTYEHRHIPRWPQPLSLEGSDPDLVASRRGQALTLAEDLRLAKEMLEQRLAKPVEHLAFPQFDGTDDAIRIAFELGYKSCWWGVLPHRPGNKVGQTASHIVRLHARYLRRLPGTGRVSLTQVLRDRYRNSLRRLRYQF